MAQANIDVVRTLMISWSFSVAATILMAMRLIMRKYRGQLFDLGDYLTMAAMVTLMARVSFSHIVVIWGTNNMPLDVRESGLTPLDLYHREVGSKLVLVTRAFYTTYIWIQKVVVMVLVKRVLAVIKWSDQLFTGYLVLCAVTYTIVQVLTFTECRPFHLYWQVLPDPGICVKARIQLIVLGTCNILTDLILIFLPMSSLLRLRKSRLERLRLISVFSIGFFDVIVTLVRVPINSDSSTSELSRTTFAALEIFAAACVANIPILYGLHRQSQRYLDTSSHLQREYRNSIAPSISPKMPKFDRGVMVDKRDGSSEIKVQTDIDIEMDSESVRPSNSATGLPPWLHDVSEENLIKPNKALG